MRKFSSIFILFAASFVLLAIFSFSQVDLNLTLSTNSLYQLFQTQLTSLGYFHRLLSIKIFILILFLLHASYFILHRLVNKNKLTKRNIWFLIGLATLLLIPSYPAFSHDIFNYIFDARIVTKYGLSPWSFSALDFPADDWIRFMRWTHRPTVYPPIWIGLSTIPSFLGLGKFIVTLGWFKIISAAAYLGSASLIYKLAKLLKHKKPLRTLVLFAFNPLVIIEGLVNAHMEMVMIYFGLLSLYLLLKKRKTISWASFLASVGIKYMTVYLGLVLIKGKKYLRQSIWLGMLATAIWILWYGFQPWYILWVFPFALLVEKTWERQFLINSSVAALFWYIPLVLLGDFDLPDPNVRLTKYVLVPLLIFILLRGLKYKQIST